MPSSAANLENRLVIESPPCTIDRRFVRTPLYAVVGKPVRRFNHARPWSSTNRAGVQAATADPER
jgi:hypothetical protein